LLLFFLLNLVLIFLVLSVAHCSEIVGLHLYMRNREIEEALRIAVVVLACNLRESDLHEGVLIVD